jgi:hypothetical protein
MTASSDSPSGGKDPFQGFGRYADLSLNELAADAFVACDRAHGSPRERLESQPCSLGRPKLLGGSRLGRGLKCGSGRADNAIVEKHAWFLRGWLIQRGGFGR